MVKAQTSDLRIHHLQLELYEPVPAEIEAGGQLAFKVCASCQCRCDLTGFPVKIIESDRIIADSRLVRRTDDLYEVEFLVEAPSDVAEHTWNIALDDAEGDEHDETRLALIFSTRPHNTSIAVWDVPSPAVLNGTFGVKVGLKCSARCQLSGAVIDIYDEAGDGVGHGTLGESTWPGTEHLYWAVVQLTAPPVEKVFAWTARFTGEHGELPHKEACGSFSFRTAPPPNCCVTIHVVAKDTGVGLQDVEIRLGLYEAFTDECGIAAVDVPTGTYDLSISRDGFKAEPRLVAVAESVRINVEAETTLTKAEWEEKLIRFEEYPWG